MVSPLIGKKLLQLNPQQCAVPLLHPIAHQLPFATSLQVYSSSSGRSSSRDVPPGRSNVQAQPQANNSLVELHYVISGVLASVCLCSAHSAGLCAFQGQGLLSLLQLFDWHSAIHISAMCCVLTACLLVHVHLTQAVATSPAPPQVHSRSCGQVTV